jgi:hypothetical protein
MSNRIHYAIQQVSFKALPTDTYVAAHGVQAVGMTANFNLEQVFEFGQLAIYENIENIPDVEFTTSKVLDGYPLLYHLATSGTATTSPTITGRAASNTFVALSIFEDTEDYANGVAPSICESSGMFVSSVGYNFPVDDNFSEDITLVGNDRIWKNDARIVNSEALARSQALSADGAFDNEDAPQAITGVQRRENLIFGTSASGTDVNGALRDPDITILPNEIDGISASGTNELNAQGEYTSHVSNITVSADLGREEIFELGRRSPYHRFINFPLEVTCEIEVTSTGGDLISATEVGILGETATCTESTNLSNQTIRIAACEGTRIYLGIKNKLASVNYSGGDAGGGNVTVSYSYSTFNDLTVVHSGDPHPDGATWWAARDTYLVPAAG